MEELRSKTQNMHIYSLETNSLEAQSNLLYSPASNSKLLANILYNTVRDMHTQLLIVTNHWNKTLV